jgi:glutamate racemase
MTDERPIGVFDSGVGGLTVLRALRAALPDEPTVYLGDTARVPYGTRSAATVVKYALNNARTLVKRADIKLLVVACNTVSAVALEALEQDLPIPVVGVIDPGAKAALSSSSGADRSRSACIAVLGTAGTQRSGAYPRALKALGHEGIVVVVKAPLLVPLAEEGWTTGEVPRLVARRYLEQLPQDVDVVVLGCTHYPLLAPVIRAALQELRPRARVVDGAEATAIDVAALLDARGLRVSVPAHRHRLLVTDAPEQMVSLAPAFLGSTVALEEVELVDVEMTA